MESETKPVPDANATPPQVKSLSDCFWDAAVNAFVVVLLGRIALTIVGGILGRMIPDAPPVFASASSPEMTGVLWLALGAKRFQILFAIVFFVCLRMELQRRSPAAASAGQSSRWERVGRKFSEKWFGSLVGNAFLAMVMAVVLAKLPSFSFWKIFWGWVLDWLQPGQLLGDGVMHPLRPWLEWYDHNHARLHFWVLYIAAVSDDFGIPNYKSLARWCWRRWTRVAKAQSTA